MKILLTVVILVVLAAGAALIYIYGGYYNIAASEKHSGFVMWLFNATMENSAKKHAKKIESRSSADTAAVSVGFRHYRKMCETCHGAPGVERSEIGKGLNPMAPDLAHEAEEWSAQEIYWITKNGIRMTGMPAFGKTHSEEELWAIVAFVNKLPSLSAQEYEQMAAAWEEASTKPANDHSHHSH